MGFGLVLDGSGAFGGSGLTVVLLGRDKTAGAGSGDGDLAFRCFKRAKGGDGLLAFFLDLAGCGGGEGDFALRLGAGETTLFAFFLGGGGEGLLAFFFCTRGGGGEGDFAFRAGAFFLGGLGLGLGDF